jgi:hypothetical protein
MDRASAESRSPRGLSRRRFLGSASATLAASLLPGVPARGQGAPRAEAVDRSDGLVWAYLMHLGMHFWADRATPMWKEYGVTDTLRCETDFWRETVDRAARSGVNMIVVDLLEGVQYRSHPELAIKGSWSRDQLREELHRMRELGIEPIPKLNFSAAHDTWLGEYGRMLSTRIYYEVCRDLIAEAIELFDKPRFLHLGMDEETAEHQRDYAHVVIRQHELWWHDLNFYVGELQKAGVRPWVWSDYEWHNPEQFYAHMPTSILQSNWYYGDEFGPTVDRAKTYNNLDLRLYDQIPTGSNWLGPANFEKTVEYCAHFLDRQRLKGFLQTTWVGTVASARGRHVAALAQVDKARSAWNVQYSKLQASA